MIAAGWISTHPQFYGFVDSLMWAALVAVAAFPPARAKRGLDRLNRIAFAVLTVGVFYVDRWPLVVDPVTLNPDEAQMTAQAIKALSDPLPWHGFDGTTSGPLNSYVLMLPRLWGSPLTMQTTHFLATVLELGTIFAISAAVATLFGRAVGRCAALTLLPFYAFAQSTEYLHYSSEHLPLFLLACSLWALAYVYRSGPYLIISATAGGVLLGLAPFAKLQCALLVAYIGATFVIILAGRARSRPGKHAALLWFCGAGIGTLTVVIGLIAAGGSLHDAFVSYLLSTAAYSQAVTSLGLAFFLAPDPVFEVYALAVIVALVILSAIAVWIEPQRRNVRVVAFAGGLNIVALWTVRLANHPYQHYLLFTVVSMACLVAVLLGTIYRDGSHTLRTLLPRRAWIKKRLARTVLATVVTVVALPALMQRLAGGSPFPLAAPGYLGFHDRMAAGLRHVIPAQTRIAVWGWMPQFYVDSQTIMATKDAHTYFEMIDTPYRAYFRERYMQSMHETPPEFFVDAVTPGSFGFTNRAVFGIATFPKLAALIARDYLRVAEINGVDIYRRRIPQR